VKEVNRCNLLIISYYDENQQDGIFLGGEEGFEPDSLATMSDFDQVHSTGLCTSPRFTAFAVKATSAEALASWLDATAVIAPFIS